MIELARDEKERAAVVGLATHGSMKRQAEEYLDELVLLADTAGATVLHKILQERGRIDPALYIGKGKVEQLAQLVEADNLSLIIFDDDLSPAQVRNLESAIKRKIIDRSGLILDIFAARAKTNEARIQVELAQLQYLLPRLTRQWTHLSKQYGGIGTKGPGETQIETDRRKIRERISHLKKKLEKISRQREIRRRRRTDCFNVSLVGYTNAGKSTLLNALSDSHVFVENRLFATLDTTTRTVLLPPSTKILLSDTVGFIRKLPHHLVASFTSTLEEVIDADVLLHVIDTCHPQLDEQIATVIRTLDELGASHKPLLHIFNKIDALHDRFIMHDLQSRFSPCVFVSAERGINLSGLKEMLGVMIRQSFQEISFTLPVSEYKALSSLHELTEITEQTYEDGVVVVKARVSAKHKEEVARMLKSIGGIGVPAQRQLPH
ncbi:MAG: GTPase HflX [Bacteroidota bacterium]|nr:GTPase HflX [Bacteroidota bacterium]